MERLLENPCCLEQLESPTKSGLAALHVAASAGQKAVLEVLLDRGSGMNVSGAGMRILELSCEIMRCRGIITRRAEQLDSSCRFPPSAATCAGASP